MTSKARPLLDLQDGISGVLPPLSLSPSAPAPPSFFPLSDHRGLPLSSLAASAAASSLPPSSLSSTVLLQPPAPAAGPRRRPPPPAPAAGPRATKSELVWYLRSQRQFAIAALTLQATLLGLPDICL